jgi:hypothetical protein
VLFYDGDVKIFMKKEGRRMKPQRALRNAWRNPERFEFIY